jgi:hypothetical protein
MSYTFLQEQGAESSVECFSDIEQFVRLKLNRTAEKSSCNDNETESCRGSQFGTMCEPLTGNRGEELQTLCAEGSHARTSVAPAAEPELKAKEADYGVSLPVSLAKYDQNTHSLKTLQTLLYEDCTESLLILPKWGWMRDGECFLLAPLVLHTCDEGCSLWPTPRADGRDNCGGSNARKQAMKKGTYIGRYPNPTLQERLMGWPESWTDCAALAMDKFRQWLLAHGVR